MSNDLLSFLEKYTEDNSYVVLVTDQNSCIVRNHDQVISRISKEDNSVSIFSVLYN
ncbi:unnamed protein product [Trichobilharzia regenti]|nr:unnamed protein product [Trichobilharzia regenti]